MTYSEENSLLGKSLISTCSISLSLSLKWVGWGGGGHLTEFDWEEEGVQVGVGTY